MILIPIVAFGASLLTFFSGFGLGTLLMPAFAVFFSVELAVTLTAIVHFLNGLFKLALIGRHARIQVLIKFGIPAMLSALFGALLLTKASDLEPVASYQLFGKQFFVLPIKLLMAVLISTFTFIELSPKLKSLEFSQKYLSLGGVLSGFFGGLSGHQGALRSAFLARAGLTKEEFVGTGAAIASLIDIARLSIYSNHLSSEGIRANFNLLAVATLAAFVGALLGNQLLKKMTMGGVQVAVSSTLLILALALGTGII